MKEVKEIFNPDQVVNQHFYSGNNLPQKEVANEKDFFMIAPFIVGAVLNKIYHLEVKLISVMEVFVQNGEVVYETQIKNSHCLYKESIRRRFK